jgi:predicted PurR-regulated permease PerM
MAARQDAVVANAAARASTDPGSVLTPDVDLTVPATPAEEGAPTPDIRRTGEALARPSARSAALTVIAVLGVLYTLYFARGFLVPITFAILLNLLLSPALRGLTRTGLRPTVGAAIIVLGLLGAVAGAGYALATPMARWVAAAPAALTKAEAKIRRLIKPVETVSRTARQVEEAAGAIGGPSRVESVVVRTEQSLGEKLVGNAERLVTSFLEVLILLFFLLSGGDLFLQKLIKVLPQLGDRMKAVEVARATEAAVSAYLSTALILYSAEGVIVGVLLWLLGMPSPVFWGLMVAVLEFIPYLGAAVLVAVLTIAGLTQFDSVGHALLVPTAFLAVNLIQANIVWPLLLGHRLTLNPVAIFIGLTFFFWIWGVPGAFLAVPVLATFKILCDHIASLAAVGEFLGERDENERRVVIRT